MINLSAFGYEKDINISDIIPETWGRKDFINGQMVEKFEKLLSIQTKITEIGGIFDFFEFLLK